MAIVTHGKIVPTVRTSELSRTGKIGLACLLIWGFAGPVLGIFYGYQVNNRTWFDLATLSADQQIEIQAQYFSNAAFTYVTGVILWIAGMIGLGATVRFDRSPG